MADGSVVQFGGSVGDRSGRNVKSIAKVDDFRNVLGRGREDNDVGAVFFHREAIAFVDNAIGVRGKYSIVPE